MGAPSCTTKRWQICEIRGEKRDAHSTQSRIGANRLSARKITHGGGRGPVAPPVFKTGLAGIAFAGGFDSLPPPSAAPLRSGTQCGAPLVRLDPTRSLTYGVNRQLRKMREEVQFLRNLYEASSGFELHPPWTAYLSVRLLRNLKAVSGIPTVSIDS